MSDTYNILKKYAYWEYEKDPNYGVSYKWLDGPAPEGYTDPMEWASVQLPGLMRENFPKEIRKPADQNLAYSLAFPGTPEHLRALNIYHQLVRASIFNTKNDTIDNLRRTFPYMASEADNAAMNFAKNNAQVYGIVRTLGERVLGGEIDHIADQQLANKFRGDPENGKSPVLFWGDNKDGTHSETYQNFIDQSRKRTNSYSFANYAPGMIAAGLIPTAIGSLMGRPFLGMLLGALLSGGVGYYGYNRLNNPNFQGYGWLDKKLGYTPQQTMSEEAQDAWDKFNPKPAPAAPVQNNNPIGSGNVEESVVPEKPADDPQDVPDEIDLSGLDDDDLQ